MEIPLHDVLINDFQKVEHPAAKMIVMAANMQEQEVIHHKFLYSFISL